MLFSDEREDVVGEKGSHHLVTPGTEIVAELSWERYREVWQLVLVCFCQPYTLNLSRHENSLNIF